jgi:putative (di)nucleoside polyphosphate hydrolase
VTLTAVAVGDVSAETSSGVAGHTVGMARTFRAGVGAVILDRRGRVLAFERHSIPGSWQLPQGGIDDDESSAEALWREVLEETGLARTDLEVLAEVPEWLGYELPVEARSKRTGFGQVHKWWILRSSADDPPVRLDPGDGEFRAWQWMDMTDLTEQVVDFRRPVYRRLSAFVAELGV